MARIERAHGTPGKYVTERCRCWRCRGAWRIWYRQYAWRKANPELAEYQRTHTRTPEQLAAIAERQKERKAEIARQWEEALQDPAKMAQRLKDLGGE